MAPVGFWVLVRLAAHAQTVTATAGVAAEAAKPRVSLPGATVDEEVVVRGRRVDREVVDTQLESDEASRIPGTAGDALRAVETLAGVARSAAGSGELVIWGAAPSDTRAYINDVPVPRLFHLGGSRSILPSAWVRSVNLVPGGYGPDYGRSVGGLVRAEARPEAPSDGVDVYATADLLDVGAGGSWAIGQDLRAEAAVRGSVLQATFGEVVEASSRQLVPIPQYFDYQARLAYEASADRFYEILVFGTDDEVDRSSAGAARRTAFTEITRDSFHRFAARYDRLSWDGTSTRATLWFGIDQTRSVLTFEAVPAGRRGTTLSAGLRASERRILSEGVTLLMGLDFEGARADLSQRWCADPSRPGGGPDGVRPASRRPGQRGRLDGGVGRGGRVRRARASVL